MTDDSSQLAMFGTKAAKLSPEVEDELARGCRSRHHALVKCYEVSNLAPKQVYTALGIDQAVFSKILSGKVHPDPDKYFRWMEVCGNLIPVRYDVWKIDHEMKPVQSTLEAELERVRAERDEERQLNRRLVEMIRGQQ